MFLYISDVVEETHLRVRRPSLNHNIFIKQREGKKSTNLAIAYYLGMSKDDPTDPGLSKYQIDSSSSGGESGVGVYSRMGYIY